MSETWDIVTLNGIDYVRIEEKVRTAIKLQELVKRDMESLDKSQQRFHSFGGELRRKYLQSLVEESEK